MNAYLYCEAFLNIFIDAILKNKKNNKNSMV